MQLVDAMARIGVESAFEVLVKKLGLSKTRAESIIHLKIGAAGFPHAEACSRGRGKQALDQVGPNTAPPKGFTELRESIRRLHLANARNQGPVTGTRLRGPRRENRSCIFAIVTALLQAGDEAIYPNPGFPIYGVDD